MSPRARRPSVLPPLKTPTSGHRDAAVHTRMGLAAPTIATRCRIGSVRPFVSTGSAPAPVGALPADSGGEAVCFGRVDDQN
jgi:hypothetical protein